MRTQPADDALLRAIARARAALARGAARRDPRASPEDLAAAAQRAIAQAVRDRLLEAPGAPPRLDEHAPLRALLDEHAPAISARGADLLGSIYEQSMRRAAAKAGGIHYTPRFVVDALVARTLGRICAGKTPAEAGRVTVVDPACGGGSFLLGVYRYLLAWHLDAYRRRGRGEGLEKGPDGTWRLTPEKRVSILLDHIHGVDIDPDAVEVTRQSLLIEALGGAGRGVAPPDLEGHVKQGDALFSPRDVGAGAAAVRPFDWERAFPEVFRAGGFDLVIGNPPYLPVDAAWRRGDPRRELLASVYPEVYRDKTDLLFYFMARALRIARGRVGLLVSRAFLEAYKADKLRAHLAARAAVEEIIDFRNARVFPGAGITTCFVSLRVGPAPGAARVARFVGAALDPGTPLGAALDDGALFERSDVDRRALGGAPWVLVPDRVSALYRKIDAAGDRLDRVLRLGQGMQTGRNDVFGGRTEQEIRAWKVPDGMWFKRATNTDIQRYAIRDRGEYLLYVEDVRAFTHLPAGVRRHLRAHAASLEDRAAFQRGNCDWWKYTWPLHEEWYDRPRILCPYLATTNRFALDRQGRFLGLTDTTVLFDGDQPEDLRYLLALLNSRVLSFRFRGIGKLKSGGLHEYFWNSVAKLPIRRIDAASADDRKAHDALVALADRMHALVDRRARGSAVRARIEREIAAVDRAIDAQVYDLYRLSAPEVATVEATLASSPG